MADDPRLPVGYHDLLRDLQEPGCPVCRGANEGARRYLDALLWEFVNDVSTRQRLRASHGICREHTVLALAVVSEQAGSMGVAILYGDFIAHVTDEIENLLGPSPTGSRLRRKHPRSFDGADPHLGCAACEAAHRVARNYLAILSSSDRESEIGAEARRDLRFLCLPHLRLGLEIAPDRTGAANLFEIYARGAHEAIRDLAQYVRKQDYRHRDEPRGRETDSWIRAAYLMVGTPALRPSLRGSGGRPATRGGTA